MDTKSLITKPKNHWRTTDFWFLLSLAVLLAGLGIWLTRVYIMDDALITLRYAFNFARFGIPIWNPADLPHPSMGYTSLLWMGLNTLPALITSNKDILLICAKLLSAGSLLFIISAVCKAVVRTSLPSLAKVILVLLIFTQFGYGLHVNSGMETLLFSMLMLFTLIGFGEGRFAQAYLFGALAFLARPEGALLVMLLFLVDLVSRKFKRITSAGIGYILLLSGVYFLLTTWYGDFLPNTFYAKQELFDLTGFKRTLLFIVTIALPFIYLALYASFRLKNRTSLLMLITAAVYTLYYLSVDPIMNVMSRYQWPALVLLTYASIPAVEHLALQKKTRVVLILLALMTAGLNLGNFFGATYFANATGHSMKNIIQIGKTLAQYRQPDRWLVYHDAGAVCYFSDWNTYETIGLTNGQLAHKRITLQEIYSQPDAVIALRNFDLSSSTQKKAQAQYTEMLAQHGWRFVQNIPVLYVEGQRNFVVAVYAKDPAWAGAILANLEIEDSFTPDASYKLYQLVKNLVAR